MIQTRLCCTTLVLLSALVGLEFGCGDDAASSGAAGSDAPDGAAVAAADGSADGSTDAAPDPEDAQAAADASVEEADAADEARQQDASSTVEPMAHIEGVVFSASSRQPLQGAVVEVAGGPAASTDDGGRFSLSLSLSGRAVLTATLDGFATGVEPVSVADGGRSVTEVHLLPIGSTHVIEASLGGTVEGDHGQLSIPPHAFVRADGSPVEGQVRVELTALDPTLPGHLVACPGDFGARLEDDSRGLLESVVPMDISARQDGELLGLAAGAELQVSFPVPPSQQQGASPSVALWSLEPTIGSWLHEGEAALRRSGERAFYDAAIGHLSWWSAASWRAVTCVRGCVTFEGAPVPQAWVTANGISFASQASSWAAEDGCFVEDIGAGEQFSLRAAAIDGVSRPLVVDAPTTEMRAAQDAAACLDVGTLELLPRPAEADGCPAGSVRCDGVCVDLFDDPTQCGACGARCEGGQICIAGRCDCAPGSSLCTGVCTDTGSSWQHCGQCGQECNDGERCSDGACQPIVCGAGLQLCGNECVDVTSHEEVCGGCVLGFGVRGRHRVGVGGPCDQECPGADGRLHCADFQNDRDDCGACGNVCGTGDHCVSGSCVPIVCPASQTLCGNACVDGDSCGVACGSGEICDAGACRCPSGTYCNGECVDTASSPAHCGGCSPPPEPLVPVSNSPAGCELAGYPDSCPVDGRLRCTDFQSDRNHCGACDIGCGDGEHCVSGSCAPIVCAQGQTLCGNVCVEGQTCGVACDPGELCLGGSCDCPSDFYCGGTCVDTMTSSDHCGGCTRPIQSGRVAPPCDTLECCMNSGYDGLCPAGNGVRCAQLQTSRFDCGSCGTACAVGESCEAGSCAAIVCPAGQVLCDNDCLDGDVCGERCDSCTEQCVAGSCTPLGVSGPECL